MDAPKFEIGDAVTLSGVVDSVTCYNTGGSWVYTIRVEGSDLESLYPHVHERAIERKTEA
jgi:hypothetical protein